MSESPIMNGVLNSVEHAKIIADMERISLMAGVQGKFLYSSMKEYCDTEEITWVRKFHSYRTQGVPGLLLEGVSKPDTRCQAIAGALIRNYIDARVIPLNALLDLHKEGEVPSPTVLLIPNLFITAIGKSVSAWSVQVVYDLLLQRSVQNKPSVCYVENMLALNKAYGSPFADFLTGFKQVK